MSTSKGFNSKNSFVLGLLVGLCIIAVVAMIFVLVFYKGDRDQQPVVEQEPSIDVDAIPASTISTFNTKEDSSLCTTEDGKPIVYLFSTTWCPHCEWVKEAFDLVAKKYVEEGKIAAYHWEVDISDDTLTSEVETEIPAEHNDVFQAFNSGGSIPTFVFGCKYYRIGNGYEKTDDLVAEVAEFKAVIESLLK